MVHRSTNLYLLVCAANQLPVFRKKTCIYWYALPISYHFFKAKLEFIGMPCQSATSFSKQNLYLLVYIADQLPVFRKKTCVYWYTPPISYQFFARKLVFIGIHRQSATIFSKQNLYLLVCPANQLPFFQSKTCVYWYTPPNSYHFSKANLVFIGLQFHHHKNMSTYNTHTTH